MVAEQTQTQLTITPMATALTIAGSDPSGGAGLQADIKTFQQLGCFGMSVVTLLTVQNTVGVERVEIMPSDLVEQQLDAVLTDIPPCVIKAGALGTATMVETVARKLEGLELPVVVDPVLVSKHGHRLADDASVDAYRAAMMPHATVFTPNLKEAEALLDRRLNGLDEMAQAAADLQSMGPHSVLLKAGSHDGIQRHMLATSSGVQGLEIQSLPTAFTHGSGCVLSAYIAACFALQPKTDLAESEIVRMCRDAISGVYNAIEFHAPLGQGIPPVETRVLSASFGRHDVRGG